MRPVLPRSTDKTIKLRDVAKAAGVSQGTASNAFSRPEIVREEVLLTSELETIKDLPCETKDGHRVQLWVNTGLMTDVLRSRERGAELCDIPPGGIVK